MKPKTHLYVHPHTPAAAYQQHLENLEGLQQSAMQVCHALGLQTLMRCGRWRVILDTCPVDPSHKTPADSPEKYPLLLKSNHIYCEQGDHKIGILQLFELFTEDPKDIPKKVAEMKVGIPQLCRSYGFETGEEGALQRAVGTDPHQTLAELYITKGEPVRGIVIECPSLELARQLFGQPASRKKMNICEDVPLRPDGTLADIRWHGAWITPLERLLLKAQDLRAIKDQSRDRAHAQRVFDAQQVLRRAGV